MNSSPNPDVSIVVPTRNRRADLARLLGSLSRQDFDRQFEVVVVADGCSDDTVEYLRQGAFPFALHVHPQPHCGPAGARNVGARQARGRFLLFLDDDVEAAPGLIAAHCRAQQTIGGAVIGPYPPAYPETGLLQIEVKSWWYGLFDGMLSPGHRFSFRDVLSGNLSIGRGRFEELGGFDSTLTVHEDYEFGIRLLKAGERVSAAGDALAWHHERISLERMLARRQQEARADIAIAFAHPELAYALPFARPSKTRNRTELRRLLGAARGPAAEFAVRGLLAGLERLEEMKLRRRWRVMWQLLQDVFYWRGIAAEHRSALDLEQLITESRLAALAISGLNLDIAEGLTPAAQRLDRKRPHAVDLYYRERLLTHIGCEPGSEPILGRHLRHLVATRAAVPYLEALAQDGRISGDLEGCYLGRQIRARSQWFGPPAPEAIWLEQYSQWSEHDWLMNLSSESNNVATVD